MNQASRSRNSLGQFEKGQVEPIEGRFWKKVKKTGGCWIWVGAKLPNGYGAIYQEGKVVYAHRVSYTINLGAIAPGKQVHHHCDNPSCVRPDHLWVGLQIDNVRDMDAKGRRKTIAKFGDEHWTKTQPDRIPRGGRHWSKTKPWLLQNVARGDRNGARLHPDRIARGELVAGAKLISSDVIKIRARFENGEQQTTLAKSFGVSLTTIHSVVHRRTWKHLP